jgi:hypothetical protein
VKRNSKLESFRARTGIDGAADAHPTADHDRTLATRRAAAGVVAAAVAALSVATMAAPGFAVGWDIRFVAVAVAAAVVSWRMLRHGFPASRLLRAFTATLVVLCCLFVIGSRDQVVIDGKVYAANSQEARSHRLVVEIFDDLEEMSRLDTLLALGQSDAQASYAKYEPARDRLVAISAKWARVDLAELPDPDFIDIVNITKTAGTFGAEAMEIRFALLTEPDQRSEEALVANRATFSAAVLDAGSRLLPLAERYMVNLRPVTE